MMVCPFAKNDDISVYRRNNIGIVYQDLCLIDDLMFEIIYYW